ncbi:hypothetical protein M3Y14_31000 (plasmid) [Bacillus thuringiensis]|uniref:delta endotoxin C-terminal domain-containing protein n=1 Tax=Bacillus thuringiensis TaxID=1428 RepID=UPI002224778B|nr:delta endotoxin C-terminal domain-containing protein [Bacillus thuringiensis]UYX55757.1 hypothetical protein M3Y14_31000 [Bacillus thuringiensis]
MYTEPLATPEWLNFNRNPAQFQQVENDLIRPPSLLFNLSFSNMGVGILFNEGSGRNPQTIVRHRTSHVNIGNTAVVVTPWQGAINANVIQEQQVSFNDFSSVILLDVFNIDSQISSRLGGQIFGTRRALFHMVREGGNTAITREINLPEARGPISITSNIPGTNSATPTASDYTHRISSITATEVGTSGGASSCIAYGWTHVSAERTNRIIPNRITQIPAVKSHSLITVASPGQRQTQVVRGPGHTGGNLIVMGAGTSRFHMTITSSGRQRYRVRLRYASLVPHPCQISIPALGVNVSFTLPATTNFYSENPPYSSFGYTDVPMNFETPNGENTWVFELITTNSFQLILRI